VPLEKNDKERRLSLANIELSTASRDIFVREHHYRACLFAIFGRMTTYLATGQKTCRPLRTSALYFYVSNRIALDFWYIFLEIEGKIVSYTIVPAIAQGEMRLILRPFCRNISYSSIMKSYCLSDISPSRTHNRRDRSPVYRLCYVTEQYVPRIGYLKERVRT
jgi:hypothetical protein